MSMFKQKINSRGDVTHGVGGGFMCVNNKAIRRGGASGWYDDNRVAFCDGQDDTWDVSLYDVRDGSIKKVYEGPLAAAGKLGHPPLVMRPYSRSFLRSVSEPRKGVLANDVVTSGSGHLASWLGSTDINVTGIWSTVGFRDNDGGLLGMGPDGAICYKPSYQSNGPTHIRELSGEYWKLLDGHAEYVSMHPEKKIAFMTGMKVYGVNLPVPLIDSTGGV